MSKEKIGVFFGCLIIGLFSLFCFFLIGVGIFWLNVLPPTPNRTNFRLYSADKLQCVTVITQGSTRFIINGEHKSPPKFDYIKLDITEITSLEDEIGVCWNNGKYKWEIVNPNAKVIENKLDTLKYRFNTDWEKDEIGIPTIIKYSKPNCGTIELLNMKTYDKTLILEN